MKIGAALGNLGRAPVPEWEEVARAAWPRAVPASWARLAGSSYLPVLAGCVLAQVLAVGFGWPWLGLIAWLLAATLEWAATAEDASLTRLLDLVGFRASYRALLRSLLLAALGFVVVGAAAALPYLGTVFLIQLAWLAQPVLATWLSRSAPPLEYRPLSAAQPAALRAHAAAYARAVGTPGVLVGTEAVAALGMLLGFLVPLLPLLAAVVADVIAVGWMGWTALQAVRIRRAQAGWGDALVEQLSTALPRFLVYVSLAARQSGYIVNQWLPAFNQLPLPGIVLTREASQLRPLAATTLPVVYAPTTRGVERLTLQSIRVAFYLAYGEKNTTLLREPRLRHVMLAHGDSDKATSASALIRAFDETWVAGAAAVERFRAAGIELSPQHFALIGRPQVAGLPVGPTQNSPKVLLYAPTFEGYYAQTTLSSLDVMGVELVREILRTQPDLAVWFRPHPSSGVVRPSMLAAITEIETLLRAAGPQHRLVSADKLSLPECLAGADLLVSDVSSVVSDYLATERPIIVCNPAGLPAADFVAAYPSQASSYLVGPDLDELAEVLSEALGEDPLQSARIAMKEYVLGDPAGGPQAALAWNLERLCGSSVRP